MNIFEKLQAVQSELKAPKGQYNSFGKYHYRSCEDILEALKPVLAKHKAAVIVGDEVVQIGDRYYIKATARFYDTEGTDSVVNTAWARESDDKKGMDSSQITGTASSYARKYALNGLFLIDDTKDADTDEHHNQTSAAKPVEDSKITRIAKMKLEMERTGISAKTILAKYKIQATEDTIEKNLAKLSDEQYRDAMETFARTADKGVA